MIETNDGPAEVFEDQTPHRVETLRSMVGKDVTFNLPGRIVGVGAKGMGLEVRDIYGEWQPVRVPIEKVIVTTPPSQG
jgi:hypothetical protein